MMHKVPDYFLNPQHPITVQVIGCGGTGSQVISQLARINEALKRLGHLGLHVTVYDNDIITDANMGRQLFSPAELGMNKAVAMITRLNRFFGTTWKAVPTLFDGTIPKADRMANMTITCVDTVQARLNILSLLEEPHRSGNPYERTYYWMDIGNNRYTGQFVLGHIRHETEQGEYTNKLPHVFEKFPKMKKQKDKDSGPSCSLAEALNKQDLFVNSMLAQLACGLIWKLFRDTKVDYHGAFMNLKTLQIAPLYL